MKKLIICMQLLACLFCISETLNAQSAVINASASGTDQANTIATVVLSETIGGGIPTSLSITTTSSAAGCFSDYSYDLLVNGSPILSGICNFNNLSLSFFVSDLAVVETVSIQAKDFPTDGNADDVDINFSLDVAWEENSYEKAITAFNMPGATSSASIDEDNRTVSIDMSFDTEGILLVPDFTLSSGALATVDGESQESGVSAVNFDSAASYIVSAADESSEVWTVSVNTVPGISSGKNINDFSINGVSGTISGTDITVGLETFESLSNLSPVFTLSGGAVAVANDQMQRSGATALDFWEEVSYTVYAADGTSKNYTVSVSKDIVCGEFVDFPLGNGVYNYAIDKSWSIQPDEDEQIVRIDITNFQIDSGDTFKIYEGEDANGILIASADSDDILGVYETVSGFYIDFQTLSSSVGEGVDFQVTCEDLEHDFTAFSLQGFEEPVSIDIENQTIIIELDYGTDVSALVVDFELSDLATASVNGLAQISGETTNDYTGAVSYVITNGVGLEYVWEVIVNTPQATENEMSLFSIAEELAVINGNEISLETSAFTDLRYLSPEFSISEFASISVDGLTQVSGVSENDFTNPVSYTVTAQDGSTQVYTVTISKEEGCGTTLTYPLEISDNYTSNAIKSWLINAAPEDEIHRIGFVFFDINAGDYLRIYEGTDNTGVLLGEYTDGSELVKVYATQEMYLEFSSDATIEDLGFMIELSCLPVEADFVSFDFPVYGEEASVYPGDQLVELNLDYGFDTSALVAAFEASPLTSVTVNGLDQISGLTVNDFSSPIIYTITDVNGETTDWTVNITVTPASTEKDILSFSIEGNTALIDGDEIDVEISAFSDISNLIVDFNLSLFAEAYVNDVLQLTGVTSQNFTDPVTYTVFAQDGSTKDYTINISRDCDFILDYPLGSSNYLGNAYETWTIYPRENYLTELEFTNYDIAYGDYLRIYQGTDNNGTLLAAYSSTISNPLPFIVSEPVFVEFDANSSSSSVGAGFTINANCTSIGKDILSFSIDGHEGIIEENTIFVELPMTSAFVNQNASFDISPGASLFVGDVAQSYYTGNTYFDPVVFTVVGADGSSKEYTVTVVKDPVCDMSFEYVNETPPPVLSNGLNGSYIWEFSPDNYNDVVHLTINELEMFGTDVLSLYKFEDGGTSTDYLGYNEDVFNTEFESNSGFRIRFKGTDLASNFNVSFTCEAIPIDNSIVSFAMNEQLSEAVIDAVNHTVSLEVYMSTPLENLQAQFELSQFAEVFVEGVLQDESSTNDFSSPVTYSVVSGDGDVQDWVVTVQEGPALSENNILSFQVNENEMLIDGNSITVHLDAFNNLFQLLPSFTVSPFAKVYIGDVEIISGETLIDGSTPHTLSVVAQDELSIQYYELIVTKDELCGYTLDFVDELDDFLHSWQFAPDTEEDILSLDFGNIYIGTGDYIKVYEGTDVEGILLETITSSDNTYNSPKSFSSGNGLFIEFRNYYNNSNHGFVLDVLCEPTDNNIYDFSFTEQTSPTVIDIENNEITLTVAHQTDITQLVASFELGLLGELYYLDTQLTSGSVAYDYSSPQVLTYVDGLGNATEWTVTVNKEPASEENDFFDFALNGYEGVITGDEIHVYIASPYIDLNHLYLTYTHSELAELHQNNVLVNPYYWWDYQDLILESGTDGHNYTSPVNLLVVAENGDIHEYTVFVTQDDLCETSIDYPVGDIAYEDDEYKRWELSPDTEGDILKINFDQLDLGSGDFLKVYKETGGSSPGLQQIESFTAGDPLPEALVSVNNLVIIFTSNTETSDAENFGMILDIECITPASDFLSFSFDEQASPAIIDTENHTVTVELVYGSAIYELAPYFSVPDFVTVKVNNATQYNDGTSEQNFSLPVEYTLENSNNEVQVWTVYATVLDSEYTESDMIAFSVDEYDAIIEGNDVTLHLGPFYDLSKLKPLFESSSLTTVLLNGEEQESGISEVDFTSPVSYNVFAQDGTVTNYMVTVTKDDICGATLHFSEEEQAFQASGDQFWYLVPDNTDEIISIDFVDYNIVYNTFVIYEGLEPLGPNQMELQNGPDQKVSSTEGFVIKFNSSDSGENSLFTFDVDCALPDNDFISFSIPNGTTTIDGTAIEVFIDDMFVDLGDLEVSFESSPLSTVIKNGELQNNGVSHSFYEPQIYTVTSITGETKEYTVTVTKTPMCGASIGYPLGDPYGDDIVETLVIPSEGDDVVMTLEVSMLHVANNDVFRVSKGQGFSAETLFQSNVGATPELPLHLESSEGFVIKYFYYGATNSFYEGYEATLSCAALANDIVAFSFEEQVGSASIDSENHQIDIEVAAGTDLTSLVADFELSSLAIMNRGVVQQVSGESSNDYSDSVIFLVIDNNGEVQEWIVNVTEANLQSWNELLSFEIDGIEASIIDDVVNLHLPVGYALYELSPVFSISQWASIVVNNEIQESGVTVQSFEDPLVYTIIAQNGETADYTVTITKDLACGLSIDYPEGDADYSANDYQTWLLAPDNEGEIITVDFSTIDFATGDILKAYSGDNVTNGTYLTHFNLNSQTGLVSSDGQMLLEFTSNNYSQASGFEFDVVCSLPENDIVSFEFVGVTDQVDIDSEAHTVDVLVYYGTDLNNLNVDLELSPLATASIYGVPQTGGVSDHDFSTPVIYTITDLNGNSEEWTVNTSHISISEEKDILSFSVGENEAVITDNVIELDFPAWELTNSIPAVFTASPLATVYVDGELQTSGETMHDLNTPLEYTVVAQNGSSKTYTVQLNQAAICGQLIESSVESTYTTESIYYLAPPEGQAVVLYYNEFDIPASGHVIVYDGLTTNYQSQIANYTAGDVLPETQAATSLSGALTVRILHYEGVDFEASVSCVSLEAGNDFLSFDLNTETLLETIDPINHSISFTVADDINVTNLVPTFELSPLATADIYGLPQLSGVTSVDFSTPKLYELTAQDGTTQEWIVSVAAETAQNQSEMLSFSIEGTSAEIIDNTINIHIDGVYNPAALVAEFELSESAWAKIGSTLQESNVSVVDFTNSVVYTVVAEDETTTDYVVNFTQDDVCNETFSAFANSSHPKDKFTLIPPEGKIISVGIDNISLVGLNNFKIYNGLEELEEKLIASFSIYSQDEFSMVTSTEIDGSLTVVANATWNYGGSVYFDGVVSCLDASDANDLLSFELAEQAAGAVIDELNHSIAIDVWAGTDMANIVPNFTASNHAIVSVNGVLQESGLSGQDFSEAVVYDVEAQNGVVQTWTISVNEIETLSEANIVSFSVDGIFATIDENTITLALSPFYNPSQIIGDFELSGAISLNIEGQFIESGVSIIDFSNTVVAAVTAQDGTITEYTINVLFENTCGAELEYPLGEEDYLAYANESWYVTPEEAYITSISFPEFNLGSGDYLKVYREDGSYLTKIYNSSTNFRTVEPVYFEFTSNGSGQDSGFIFEIDCLIPEKEITYFTVPNQVGATVIDAETRQIQLTVPYSSDVTSLQPDYILSSFAVAYVNGIPQYSEVSINDFTNPVSYSVEGVDGEALDWTVTVLQEAASTENTLLSFSINGIDAIFSGNNLSVAIEAYDSFVGLSPSFTSSPNSVVSVNGEIQESGFSELDYTSPIVYTVTAENGAVAEYLLSINKEDICGYNLTFDGSLSEDGIQTWLIEPDTPGDILYIDIAPGSLLSDDLYIYRGVDLSGDLIGSYEGNISATISHSSMDGIFVRYVPGYYSHGAFEMDITCETPTSNLLSFEVEGEVLSVDSENQISYEFSNAFIDLSSITPVFEVSDYALVTADGVVQESGENILDFTNPVVYEVIGANGLSNSYTVHLSKIDVCSAVIDYPEGDGNYPNNEVQEWLVQANTSDQYLKLNVNEFDLMNNDVLYIYDGISSSGTLIGAYSGVNDPFEVLGYQSLYLRFTSNSNSVSTGFVAEISCEDFDNQMLSFTKNGIEAVIGENTIDLDLTSMDVYSAVMNVSMEVPSFATVQYNGVEISNDTEIDYSNPVSLTVVGANGETKEYLVTVSVDSACGSQLQFSIPDGLSGGWQTESWLINQDTPGDILSCLTTDLNLNSSDRLKFYEGTDETGTLLGTRGWGYLSQTDIPIKSLGSVFVELRYYNHGTAIDFSLDIDCESPENEILSFSVVGESNPAVIDTENHSIDVYFYQSSDLEYLVADYELSSFAAAFVNGTPQLSNVSANDFSEPLSYTIIDSNGEAQEWDINVTIIEPISDKDILSFESNGVTASIYESSTNIFINNPLFSDVRELVATFETSLFATVTMNGEPFISGETVFDARETFVLLVTAEDGSTKEYQVIATFSYLCDSDFSLPTFGTPYSSNEMYYYNIEPYVIDDIVKVTFEEVIADWYYNKSISVYRGHDNTGELLGVVSSNSEIFEYSSPDGLYLEYDSNTTAAPQNFDIHIECITPENELLSFALAEQSSPADIDFENHLITVNVYHDSNFEALMPEFTLSDFARIEYNGLVLESGLSTMDVLSNTSFDIVSSNNLESQTWEINVIEIDPLDLKDFLSFSYDGNIAIIGENTVDMNISAIHDLTALQVVYETDLFVKAYVNGVEQESGVGTNDFTSPVLYTLIAQDGSTKEYTVSITKDDICAYVMDYPLESNNYTNNALEEWVLIPNTENEVLTIDFTSFDTEYNFDLLYVYKGLDDSGELLATLSGNTIPDPISSDSGLYLKFVSDQSIIRTGFDFEVSCSIPQNDFLSFAFASQTAPANIDVDNRTIAIEVIASANISNLIASYSVSENASVELNGVVQESGVSSNDFSASLTYTVISEDGFAKNWTVHLTQATSVSYYVKSGGLGTQDGTTAVNAAPYISSVVALSMPGDSIKVMEGVVSEVMDVSLPQGSLVYAMPGAAIDMNTHQLNNDGHITLSSSASLVQGIGSVVSGSGTFEVIRQAGTNTSMYNFLSSPINHIDVQAVYGGSNVLSFASADHDNGVNGWSYITNGQLNNAEGYAVSGSISPGFVGNHHYQGIVNNGAVSIGLDGTSYGSPYDGWNLIGNPYPSMVAMDDFISSNDDVGAVTVYNQLLNTYQTFNMVNASGLEIASGQGFFVEFSEAVSGTANFSNDLRILSGAGTIQRASSIATSILRIEDEAGQYYDSYIAFSEAASDAYNHNYDARLIPGAGGITLYSLLEEEAFAIQSFETLADYKMIPLGFEAKQGLHSVKLNALESFSEDIDIILIDHETGVEHNLLSEAYSFIVSEDGINEERFEIRYQLRGLGVYNNLTLSPISIFQRQEYLHINGLENECVERLTVYDISGKEIVLIDSKEITKENNKVLVGFLRAGIYLIELKTDLRTQTIQLPITR